MGIANLDDGWSFALLLAPLFEILGLVFFSSLSHWLDGGIESLVVGRGAGEGLTEDGMAWGFYLAR